MEENLSESQYDRPLSDYVVRFGNTSEMKTGLGQYPGYDWHNFSNTVAEMSDVIWAIRKQDPNLIGMGLFNKIVETTSNSPVFSGRTSHALLSIFNPGYFGDETDGSVQLTGLQKEIKDPETGRSVNPYFTDSQENLPPNLQIRRSIINAINQDLKVQEEIASSDSPESALAKSRADWYQFLLDDMSKKTQIKPASLPIK